MRKDNQGETSELGTQAKGDYRGRPGGLEKWQRRGAQSFRQGRERLSVGTSGVL
jgi:hypothetical protein